MNKKTFRLTLAATLMASAFALDLVTGLIPGLNLSLPLGGRIFGISLFPLILIGLLLGVRYGVACGIIFGVFSFLYDGYAGFFAADLLSATLVFLLDYVIAFGALGLSGLFKDSLKKPLILTAAFVVGISLRLASSTVVGAILWAQYASSTDWTNQLFTSLGSSAWLYSFVYNFIYNFTTLVVLLVIGLLSYKRINTLKEQYLD